MILDLCCVFWIVQSKVFMAAKMSVYVFWGVTQCGFVGR